MTRPAEPSANCQGESLLTEMLIMPDGRILVQNLTRPMAEILRELNPGDRAIAVRAAKTSKDVL